MPQLHPSTAIAVTANEAVLVGLLILFVLAQLLKLLLRQVAQVALMRWGFDDGLGR